MVLCVCVYFIGKYGVTLIKSSFIVTSLKCKKLSLIGADKVSL